MSVSVLRVSGAAALLVVSGLYAISLPPPAVVVPDETPRPSAAFARARGVLHVHTNRSDGSGSVDDVARAAARAGLDFVVITDHGDGTRTTLPPAYRSGVLCIDAAEISTTGGHVLALGIGEAPFRLAGTAGDVIEDIHRFGGYAVAAHPRSAKPELAWHDWSLPVDGFEWLNADSAWRDKPGPVLARALLHYVTRGPETIASLLDRPSAILERWDDASREGHPLVSVAGADAHARLGWSDRADDGEEENPGQAIGIPSYVTVFRVFSTVVELDEPLGGDAERDAAQVIAALGAGRSYTVIDAFARGGDLVFAGESALGPVGMGGRLAPGQLTRLVARVRAPAGTRLRLLRNGTAIAETSGVVLDVGADRWGPWREAERGVAFRVEAHLPGAAAGLVPWIVTNPIWEVSPGTGPHVAATSSSISWEAALRPDGHVLAAPGEAQPWHLEHDARSSAVLAAEANAGGAASLRWRFSLGSGRGPRWVAAALSLDDLARKALVPGSNVLVGLRADRPTRVSIQLRAPSDAADLRWRRSAFVGPEGRTIVMPIASLEPVGAPAAVSSALKADTLLVVVDQTNTRPGTTGTVWIAGAALQLPGESSRGR